MRNKPRKKVNPQQITDSIVKEQIQIAGENFSEIFRRINTTRIARSPTLLAPVTFTNTSGILTQLTAALPVSGKCPVLVGLASDQRTVPGAVATVVTSADPAFFDTLSFPVFFLANSQRFASQLKTLTLPTPESGQIVHGSVDSAGSIITGTGFTITKNGTGDYTINFSPALNSVPTVVGSARVPAAGVFQLASGGGIGRPTVSAARVFTYVDSGAGLVVTNCEFHFSAFSAGSSSLGVGSFEQSFAPSEFWSLDYPTNPGIVTYQLEFSSATSDAALTFGAGLYLFAAELF